MKMLTQTLALVTALLAVSCNSVPPDPTSELITAMEKRLSASGSSMQEADEMHRGQGIKRTLNVVFVDVKNVDMMDVSLKLEIKGFVQNLKNTIEGSERIEKYKVRLLKDPNDKTQSKTGFNFSEKGFTFNREDLE